jgi:hypothetical protein
MRRIGIIGLKHKAESMIQLLRKTKVFEISGIYDNDEQLTKKLSERYHITFTYNPFELIVISDLLIISKSDDNSFNLIIESIFNGKHVIIENPLKLSIKEINELIKLSSEASVSVVPFLPYRFSTCVISTKSYIFNPSYIEIRSRLIPEFKKTQQEIAENMLNMIDLIFSLIKANVKKVYPTAIKVVGSLPQIINLRFEFDNGSLACINDDYLASRDELTVNVFQKNQIVTIDLIKNYSLVKTFNRDNLLDCEITKPVVSKDENPYVEILNYLNAFEGFNTSVSILESYKYTLTVFSKFEEKLK